MGVLVVKTMSPSVVFAINESNITTAFWDYLQVLLNKEANSTTKRNHTLVKLNELSDRLVERYTHI